MQYKENQLFADTESKNMLIYRLLPTSRYISDTKRDYNDYLIYIYESFNIMIFTKQRYYLNTKTPLKN